MYIKYKINLCPPQADVSLWDKTAKTSVQTSLSYAVVQDTSLMVEATEEEEKEEEATEVTRLTQRLSTPSGCRMDVDSDMDFSGESAGGADADAQAFKLCIRKHLPAFLVEAATEEEVPQPRQQQEVGQQESRRRWVQQGRTLMLDRRTCSLCNKMFPKK